ncbi:hypothetical protein D3C71_1963010 [compost metagenome]
MIMPMSAVTVQMRSVFLAPKRSRTRSPAKRMVAMVAEKAAKPKPDSSTEAPSSLRR